MRRILTACTLALQIPTWRNFARRLVFIHPDTTLRGQYLDPIHLAAIALDRLSLEHFPAGLALYSSHGCGQIAIALIIPLISHGLVAILLVAILAPLGAILVRLMVVRPRSPASRCKKCEGKKAGGHGVT